MKNTILYRLFGLGAISKKLLPVFQEENIVSSDEGISGRFITKNVNGPGKRYINRSEGFWGCLVITKKRVVCFTYGKRQINISIDDPKISELYFNVPDSKTLSVSFESSVFRDKWDGVIEFRFRTEKAQQFGAVRAHRVAGGFSPPAPTRPFYYPQDLACGSIELYGNIARSKLNNSPIWKKVRYNFKPLFRLEKI